MEPKNKKLILGAPDALVANYCAKFGANYVWASSFIMSATLGKKDDGIVDVEYFLPIIKSLIKGSSIPVILDFDIGGKNVAEYKKNLNLIKEIGLGGICIEDESWPKFNAMIKKSSRKLISPDKMAQKLTIAKSYLKKSLLIARTHSFIVNENINILQERIKKYIDGGADAICIHNTNHSWKNYNSMLKKITINKPLFLIISKQKSLPKLIYNNKKIEYILYPNQLYRMMLYPISKLTKNFIPSKINRRIIDVDDIFNLVNKINEK